METMPEDVSPLSPPLPFNKGADATTSSTVMAAPGSQSGGDPAIHPMDPRIKSGGDENGNSSTAIDGPAGTQAEMPLAPPAGMKPLSDEAAKVALDDVYTKTDGTVFLNGIQALVRLPLVQVARDREAGLHTAGLVTGYRGSPLGGYDLTLGKAKARSRRARYRVPPGGERGAGGDRAPRHAGGRPVARRAL